MARVRECPKCDAEMEEIPYDPDVGIFGGFYCHTCEKLFDLERDDYGPEDCC